MEEKKINKFLRHTFSAVSWRLLGYYALMNLMVLLTLGFAGFHQSLEGLLGGEPQGPDSLLNNAWGYVLAIAVAMVILFAWKDSEYWHREIFHREQAMTGGVFARLLCLCVGAQLVNSFWILLVECLLKPLGLSVMEGLDAVSGDAGSFSMFVYMALLAPVFEEILFRGVVLRALQPYGRKFAILGSAVLFGVFHGNLLQTPYAFLVGLVLGYVTITYSIRWAMALHLFNNLVLADLLTRLTKNWPALAQGAVNLVIFWGLGLAAGVVLILRREQIRSYLRSESLDGRCLKWFFLNSGFLVLALVMGINMITLLFL